MNANTRNQRTNINSHGYNKNEFTFCINGKQPGLWVTWLLLKNTRCASELNIRLQAKNKRNTSLKPVCADCILWDTHADSDNNFVVTFVVWNRETCLGNLLCAGLSEMQQMRVRAQIKTRTCWLLTKNSWISGDRKRKKNNNLWMRCIARKCTSK